MKFPRKKTILENAKLDFVNIDNVLSASKKERASKISGYVLLKYPDSVDIILLREGNPIDSVRFIHDNRQVIPIEDVVKKAKTASSGLVSIYETSPDVVKILYTSFREKPIFKEKDASEVDVVKLIKKLVELKYSGFFELRKGITFSYVVFEKGYAKKGYFQNKLGVPLSNEEFLKILLKSSQEEGIRISAFKAILQGKNQAPPSTITLFLNVINDLSSRISAIVGESLGKRTLAMAFDKTKELNEWLGSFSLKGFNIEGTTVVSLEDLSNGCAYLIKDLIEFYKPILGPRIDKIVKDTLKDYRFALKNMGFYENYEMNKYEE